MATSSQSRDSTAASRQERNRSSSQIQDHGIRQLIQWGGVAGVAGFVSLLASVVVVVTLDLPDAADVATLTDFADIESGRIAEHFFYLGAVMLFALHVSVLYRVLRAAHLAPALFATVLAGFGYIIMAASSILHVSTAPLSELYTAADTSAEDQRAIEFAWHGAQSVFDTMLTTGVLLVPMGVLLFGVAMRKSPAFGGVITALTIVLGLLGTLGGVIATADPGSMFSAASVLTIALFHLVSGVRMLQPGMEADERHVTSG